MVKKFRGQPRDIVNVDGLSGVPLHGADTHTIIRNCEPFLVAACHYGLNHVTVKVFAIIGGGVDQRANVGPPFSVKSDADCVWLVP